MVQKAKAYDADEEEIIDEDLPEEEITDEDLEESEDEDPEEESYDEDLVGEEDEDLEESEDEDPEESEDEDPEESEDEDLIGEEDEYPDEESEDATCQDAEILEDDPLWRRLKRVFSGSRSDQAGNVVEDAALQRAVMDELSTMITKRVEARDSLAKQVMPFVGKFKYKHMTADQVAKYACDKLDIHVNAKNAKAALTGYLAAQRNNRPAKLYTLDSAIRTFSEDAAIEEYLKGDK